MPLSWQSSDSSPPFFYHFPNNHSNASTHTSQIIAHSPLCIFSHDNILTIPIFEFLYHIKTYCPYSLSKSNNIQSDLQILTPTEMISHLIKLVNFSIGKLYCQTLHSTFFLLACPISCNLMQLEHIVFFSASFDFD